MLMTAFATGSFLLRLHLAPVQLTLKNVLAKMYTLGIVRLIRVLLEESFGERTMENQVAQNENYVLSIELDQWNWYLT